MTGPFQGDPLPGREMQSAELDLTIGTAWTDLVAAPGAGKRIRLSNLLHFNQLSSGRFMVEVRLASSGDAKFRHSTSNQQRVWRTLPGMGMYFRVPVNTPVQARVAVGTPTAGDVVVTALYDIEG